MLDKIDWGPVSDGGDATMARLEAMSDEEQEAAIRELWAPVEQERKVGKLLNLGADRNRQKRRFK